MRAVLLSLGFAIGAALACHGQDYHCDVDEQCVTDDQPGTCEAEGWCSYADATCDSGRRWGPQAGADRDECIPRDEGSSSG
ncbi:MAG: hypothetical protein IAG13_09280 [Deltaproteobacteria bacterium]|nr:hypothetical protein [Nannocystaceae bacterium]